MIMIITCVHALAAYDACSIDRSVGRSLRVSERSVCSHGRDCLWSWHARLAMARRICTGEACVLKRSPEPSWEVPRHTRACIFAISFGTEQQGRDCTIACTLTSSISDACNQGALIAIDELNAIHRDLTRSEQYRTTVRTWELLQIASYIDGF